jgi:tetratricopeptide (TPR) repeat protein
MDKGSKDNKIVYFPHLKERLFEKGINMLQSSNLSEAVSLFEQAYEIDPSDGEVGSALVLALYETKQNQRAKEICKELLLEGQGDYFKVVELYLMILIQLNDHNEVVNTISALFDEKEVPADKEEHFSKLLSFSRRVLEGNAEPVSDPEPETVEGNQLILEGKDLQEQTFVLAELVNRNVRPFLSELLTALGGEGTHPFIQTMIVNVLREHGYNEEVAIKKFGRELTCVPAQLDEVFQTPYFKEVAEGIEDLVAQRNPTLLQQVTETFTRHCFLLYPIELEWQPEKTALAYLIYGLHLYGENPDVLGLDGNTRADGEVLRSLQSFIHELEKVSSPVL